MRRELHWTGPGRRAAATIGRLLVERRMPAELATWVAWVALSGENAAELLAADYREEKVGGHARQVREPVTGDTYLEIRVPAEWSTRSIVAALPYLRDPTIFPGVVSPDGAGGRPRHVESDDALDFARRFDAAAAKLSGKRLSVKVWLGRWQTWLDAELGDAPHPKAAYLWRTAVKAAVEDGTFVPVTLEARRARRLRRSS
jgi:hypothetical protein